jgi:hypothetical protein
LDVQSLAAGDVELIEPLLAAYPYKPYRHYRAYSRRTQTAILQAEVASAVDFTPNLSARVRDGEHQALSIARPLTWDSEFFGIRMARIDYLTASGAARLAEAALDATLDACRKASIPHVTARVDVEDVATVDLLEQRGFRLMDALVTYRIRPENARFEEIRDVGVIRDFDAGDTEQVLAIARDAFAGYSGRFQHDARVPHARAESFYLEWAQKGLSGEFADKVLVSTNTLGEVIGFLFFRRREPASTVAGTPIFGGGLGACRRDAPGAYPGLIRSGALWAEERGGVAECQTQNYNFPVIRVYEAAGGTYVRAEYTMHAWLESTGEP